MERSIIGFRQDEESHWVALLDCGHRQHTRHDPPLWDRRWVATPEGRAERIGYPLDCIRCDGHELPEDAEPFHETDVFTQDSVPAGLQREHRTKTGVWAWIEVLEGELTFHERAPFDRSIVLSPDAPGVVVPEVTHEVECTGPVRFQVQFLRVPPA